MAAKYIPPIEKFTTDSENLGNKWAKYKKAFGYYAAAIGVDDQQTKKSLFLHTAGIEIQNIFETFNFEDAADPANPTYDQVMLKFDGYFNPKRNVAYERHIFHSTEQQQHESVDKFLTRLRLLTQYCEYGDTTNDHIRDQFIDKCTSSRLRRRLLREVNLQLDDLVTIARTHEVSENQAKLMEDKSDDKYREDKYKEIVSFVKRKPTYAAHNAGATARCDRCGRYGRYGHDSNNCTVTKGKFCRHCGKPGHFERCCRDKMRQETPTKPRMENYNRKPNTDSYSRRPNMGNYNSRPPSGRGYSRNTQHVRATLETQNEHPRDEEYVFANNVSNDHITTIHVNGIPVKVMIDTGSSVNIINRQTWEKLQVDDNYLQPTEVRVFSYGNKEPLQLMGQYEAQVHANDQEVQLTFIIIDGEYPCLLGRQASCKLGMVKFYGNHEDVRTMHTDIEDILQRHSKVFQGLGKLQNFSVKVEVDDNIPPVQHPIQRLPYHIRQKVDEEIERLIALDVIEPVDSPTPRLCRLVPVVKKDGSIRLCLDERDNNKAIKKQKYPIPLIDDIIHEMKDVGIASELDFNEAFHQLELDEDSRNLTAFATEHGIFRYKRLTYGMTVALEIFQACVQQVISKCDGARNYADNIVVHGKNHQEHNERLEKVLQEIEQKGLTLNKNKCKFAVEKLSLLGYIISAKGIALGEEKVKRLTEMRPPETVSEVRGVLGLANFCSKFIPNMAEMVEPIRCLTRKSTGWQWGTDQEKAFQRLKDAVAQNTNLAYFDVNKKTKLIVDAGPTGLGAILCQDQEDGTTRPIAFASKALTDRERKYSQFEKEALAVLWGCEKFHLYLYGNKFTVFTDHKPLQVIYTPHSRTSARIERWVLRLQEYDFQIEYVKGEQNAADPLSRLLQLSNTVDKRFDEATEDYVAYITENAVPKAMNLKMIEEATNKDTKLQQVKESILSGQWDKTLTPFYNVKDELTLKDDIILRGTRIVIPEKLWPTVLDIAHESHQGIVKMKALLRTKVWWPGIDSQIERKAKECIPCQAQGQGEKPEPLKMTTHVTEPWTNLAIDICGPFPSGEYLIVLVDYFSRWPEATITKTITSEKIIEWLDQVFATHGYPTTITSDNGAQFVSKEFKTYLEENGITLRNVTPYWPQANGQVERLNRVFLKAFRAAHIEGKNWKTTLSSFLRMYRTTPHCSTQATPAELLMNRQIRTKIPTLLRIEEERTLVKDQERKEREKQYADQRRGAEQSRIKVGDTVLVKQRKSNKLSSTFNPEPMKVIEKRGPEITLKTKGGVEYRRHNTQIRRIQETKTSARTTQRNFRRDRNSDSDDEDDEDFMDTKRKRGERQRQVPDENERPKRNRKPPRHLADFVCD